MVAAPVVAALALLAASEPASSVPDPCRAAAAPFTRPTNLPRDVGRAVDAYRAAWRRACEPKANVDLAALLGDAEVLAQDARMSRSVRTIAAGASQAGAEWPLPAIRLLDGDLAVDWEAFAPFAARGGVDDVRFWRGASVAADAIGGPAWLREVPDAPGAECIRLGEVSWTEITRALDDMEEAEAAQYAGHARELRERLEETLAKLTKGPEVCGCVRGDAVAGLGALAAVTPEERRKTQAQRALVNAAAAALEALQSGRVRVSWLRETASGETTGCRTAP